MRILLIKLITLLSCILILRVLALLAIWVHYITAFSKYLKQPRKLRKNSCIVECRTFKLATWCWTMFTLYLVLAGTFWMRLLKVRNQLCEHSKIMMTILLWLYFNRLWSIGIFTVIICNNRADFFICNKGLKQVKN